MKWIGLALSILQGVVASIYTFSYPNTNGLYDIIHYDQYYTVLPDPIYPNEMTDSIILYDYSYKTRKFFTINREGIMFSLYLDYNSIASYITERMPYQINYIEDYGHFATVTRDHRDNKFKVSLLDSLTGGIIEDVVDYPGSRPLPLYGLSTINNKEGHFISFYMEHFRIKIGVFNMLEGSQIKVIKRPFSIYFNTHYNHNIDKIIGIKYTNNQLSYYEISYLDDTEVIYPFISESKLGSLQVGSAFDIYNNYLWLTFGRRHKKNIVKFNTITHEIDHIIPLSNNWNTHLLFYPGPITTMTSAKFNELGNKIDITFDLEVKKEEPIFDCDLIFTKSSVMGIGKTGFCKWNDNVLAIYPSNDATIIPGNVLALKDDTLQSKYQKDSFSSGTIIVSNNNFSKPDVIIFGPNRLSYCDRVLLDGSFTQSLDGRPFNSWQWSIEPPVYDNIEYSNPELLIDDNILTGGLTYKFTLNIITSLGIHSKQYHNIYISKEAIPQIKIIGSKIKKSYFNRRLYLTAEVYHAKCITDSKYKKLAFTWESIMPLDPISSETTKLYIKPKTLLTGKVYRFFVTAKSLYVPSYRASTYTDVTILEDRLYARISGGSNRKNPLSRPLLLDGSDSYDPDSYSGNNNIKMNYIWSCYYDGKEIDTMDNYMESIILLRSNTFSVNGTYRFCLNIWKYGIVNIREDSACVNVEYTNELYPNIQIKPLAKDKYNQDEKITLISSSYSYIGEPLEYKWELLGGTINRDDINTPITSINLVIKPDKLIAGRLYQFRLNGRDSIGPGFSQVDLVINTPPRGGMFNVNPLVGTALNTSFILLLNGWTDDADDLPLLYNFGIGDSLLNIPNDKSRLITMLDESKNGSTTIIGYIRDIYDGKVNITTDILVKPLFKPINILKLEIYASIDNLLDTGDTIGAVSLINKFIKELENRGYIGDPIVDNDEIVMETRELEALEFSISDLKYELYMILEKCFISVNNNDDAIIRLDTLRSVILVDPNNIDIIDKVIYLLNGLFIGIGETTVNTEMLNRTLDIIDILTTNITISNNSKSNIDVVLERIVVGMISNNIPNEDPVSMISDGIELLSQKKTVDTLSSLSMGNGSVVDIPKNLSLNTSVVNLDMRGLKNNPYVSETVVESDILSFTIKGDDNNKIEMSNTANPFILKMAIRNSSNGIIPVTSCNYWNVTLGEWDSRGCIAVRIEGSNLVCECNHLTDFSGNRPKYNAVDPVGDASTLRNISWQNMTTLATLMTITNSMVILALINSWRDQRDRTRINIIKSFGIVNKKMAEHTSGIFNPFKTLYMEELDDPFFNDDHKMFKERPLFFESLQRNIINEHHWISIFTIGPNNSFTRQMRLVFVYCVLIAGLTTNALFYGQENTGLIGTIYVGAISSIIITPPTLIFLASMKYAGDVEEKYKLEREKAKPRWISGNIVNVDITNTVLRRDSSVEYPYGKTILFGAIIFYLFCSYLIMLFGIKFSGQKASYWLLSSFISTASDVIIMQPVQIVGKTFMSAML